MENYLGYLTFALICMGAILNFTVKRGVETLLDSKLETVRHRLQKEISDRQNLNAISRPTLEKIFAKKVEVYTELSKIRNEFFRYENESHELENGDLFEDVAERFSGFFKRCREIIESNKLYISSDLAERYDAWYSVAQPYYKQSVLDGYEAYQSSFDDNDGRMQVYYSELGAISEMINDTMPHMKAIFDQVDKDISKIRDYVELAVSAKPGSYREE